MSDERYDLIDIQTEEVVAEALNPDGLREVLNDIFWRDSEPDFSEAGYDEIYYALINCDYDLVVSDKEKETGGN